MCFAAVIITTLIGLPTLFFLLQFVLFYARPFIDFHLNCYFTEMSAAVIIIMLTVLVVRLFCHSQEFGNVQHQIANLVNEGPECVWKMVI